jgi:hypothetical protein
MTNLPHASAASLAHQLNHPVPPATVRIGRWFTLDLVWWLVVPLLLLSVLNRQVVGPHDFWWHLRTGQIIWSEQQIPLVDRFTFTQAGEVWVNQAWLMQIAFYALYQWGGLPLILFASALTICAGYSLLLWAVSQRAGIRIGVLATLAGVVLGYANWMVRPQIISFLCFGLLVWLIEAHRQGRRSLLWWAIPLFAVWVNSHGGFVFGLALLALYILGRIGGALWAGLRTRVSPLQPGGLNSGWFQTERSIKKSEIAPLVIIGSLVCAALALNPQGPWGIVDYVLGFVQSQATTQYNLEFQPLSIRQLDGLLFFVASGLLVVGLVAIGRSGFRLSIDQILQLMLFGLLALLARRNLPWFGFIMTPILGAVLQAWWRRPPTRACGKPMLNGLLIGGMSLWLLISLPWGRPFFFPVANAWVTPATPVAAVDFLCAEAPAGARVYQELGFSSYQIWACPRLPVFMDTRIELYPLDQWLVYLAIGQARFDWEQLLAQEQITHLMVNPATHRQLLRAVEASAHWRQLYQDANTVIFEKQP